MLGKMGTILLHGISLTCDCSAFVVSLKTVNYYGIAGFSSIENGNFYKPNCWA